MSTPAVALESPAGALAPLRQRQLLTVLRSALALNRTRIGLGMVTLIVLVALIGPAFAPHSPTAFVGIDNSRPVEPRAARDRRTRP